VAIEIERLIATLEARMTQYDKAMKKALGDTDRTFSRIERRGKQMEARLGGVGRSAFLGFAKGALSALAPILSVAAAVQGAKNAMKEFGDISDQAFASGLDPEFFQGLAHQMSLFGVSTETSAGALATFAKNSGLAVAGKGRMVTALKELNPALLENIRAARNQEERIRLIADALNEEQDAAKRAAIATAAFGDAGGKIAGAFAGGSAAIDETMRKARDLGIIIDRELIARADELGDEFDTTTRIVDLQLKKALVNLGPILVWLAGLAGGIAEQLGGLAETLTQPITRQSLGTLEERLRAAETQARLGLAHGPSPASLQSEIAALRAEIFRRGESSSMQKLAALTPPATEDIPTLDEIETREAAAKAAIKQAEAVRALIADLEFEQSLLGLSKVDRDVEVSLRQAGAAATDEQRQRIEELIRATAAEEDQLERLNETMEMFGDLAKDALSSFISDLRDGKSAAEALNNVLSNIADKMIGLALDSAFSTSTLGSLFGIPGRASGGPVRAGQPYVVGEKRPELFVPSSAGRIIPQVPSGGGASSRIEVAISVDDEGKLVAIARQAGGVAAGAMISSKVPRMISDMAPGAVRAANHRKRA
jgi:hypothetical protein